MQVGAGSRRHVRHTFESSLRKVQRGGPCTGVGRRTAPGPLIGIADVLVCAPDSLRPLGFLDAREGAVSPLVERAGETHGGTQFIKIGRYVLRSKRLVLLRAGGRRRLSHRRCSKERDHGHTGSGRTQGLHSPPLDWQIHLGSPLLALLVQAESVVLRVLTVGLRLVTRGSFQIVLLTGTFIALLGSAPSDNRVAARRTAAVVRLPT